MPPSAWSSSFSLNTFGACLPRTTSTAQSGACRNLAGAPHWACVRERACWTLPSSYPQICDGACHAAQACTPAHAGPSAAKGVHRRSKRLPRGLLSWIAAVYRIKQEEVIEVAGYDAATYMRILTVGERARVCPLADCCAANIEALQRAERLVCTCRRRAVCVCRFLGVRRGAPHQPDGARPPERRMQ